MPRASPVHYGGYPGLQLHHLGCEVPDSLPQLENAIRFVCIPSYDILGKRPAARGTACAAVQAGQVVTPDPDLAVALAEELATS